MVHACPLPLDALTQGYREAGAYTDCYCTELPRTVTHAEYVEAFYTTALFKLERWLLRIAVSRPSTDAEARALARGGRDVFAAWTVEARAADQLLLCDFMGRTRSWLMVARAQAAGGTRLYFGSVVVPERNAKTGDTGMPATHRRLLGFHRLYSRMLLGAAARRFR
ncbi:MAG: hypothetical protein M3O07_02855 [Pseudomonadota bacterium]|nr:hypothetical protein [Pseudomonadota bacterium]